MTLLVITLAAALGAAIVALFHARRSGAVDVDGLRAELAADRERTFQSVLETTTSVARQQLIAQTREEQLALQRHESVLDERLEAMTTELDRMRTLVGDLERRREQSHGALADQLRTAAEGTYALTQVTEGLHRALTNSQTRGQWGERMAEDVLRAAGFIEGVNYRRQEGTRSGRPDFTFTLPGGQRLQMDVKFPLANYLAFLDATIETEQADASRAFLRDARDRVDELARRDYGRGSDNLDVVLLFIPNDQVFGFIHEQDPTFLDAALAKGVVPCGPSTLFAVLAVIRQAVDAFAVERASAEILDVLGSFRSEWSKFMTSLERLGKQLDTARATFDDVNGPRRRQLERTLDEVDRLCDERGDEPTSIRPTLVAG